MGLDFSRKWDPGGAHLVPKTGRTKRQAVAARGWGWGGWRGQEEAPRCCWDPGVPGPDLGPRRLLH